MASRARLRGGHPGRATVELTDFDTGRRYMPFVDAVAESNARGERVVLAGPERWFGVLWGPRGATILSTTVAMTARPGQ